MAGAALARGLLIQVALPSYRLAVLPIWRLSAYAREHAAVASLPELPAVLLANGSRALGTLWRDWSATAPGFWNAGQLPTLFQSRRFHAMQDGPVLVVVTR